MRLVCGDLVGGWIALCHGSIDEVAAQLIDQSGSLCSPKLKHVSPIFVIFEGDGLPRGTIKDMMYEPYCVSSGYAEWLRRAQGRQIVVADLAAGPEETMQVFIITNIDRILSEIDGHIPN